MKTIFLIYTLATSIVKQTPVSIQASYRLELKLYAQLAKQKSHRITHRGLSWSCGFDVSSWKQNQICGDFRMLSWMKGHSTWRPRPWTCHWNCGKAVAISFFVGCSLKSPLEVKNKKSLCVEHVGSPALMLITYDFEVQVACGHQCCSVFSELRILHLFSLVIMN